MRLAYYSTNGHVLPRLYGNHGYYLHRRSTVNEEEPQPITVDSDEITVDSDLITVDQEETI